MYLQYRAFSVPKLETKDEENEDSMAPASQSGAESLADFRCSVSDGASTADFSRDWSHLLTNSFATDQNGAWLDNDLLLAELANLAKQWKQTTDGYFEGRERQFWEVEKPGHAALAGLILNHSDPEQRTFVVITYGDSCFFQIRNEQVIMRAPETAYDKFASNPHLLCTDQDQNRNVPKRIVRVPGTWEPGDVFYLMTDAVSATVYWCLENNIAEFATLDTIKTQSSFAAYIDHMRATKRADDEPFMKNDDCTMIRISVHLEPVAVEPSTEQQGSSADVQSINAAKPASEGNVMTAATAKLTPIGAGDVQPSSSSDDSSTSQSGGGADTSANRDQTSEEKKPEKVQTTQ